MALTVCTWLWGDKYGNDYIARLASAVRRNLKQPHRFVCVSDRDIEVDGVLNYAIPEQDRHLLNVKGCFARLRAFDPVWQKLIQAHDGLVSLDLDNIVTGPLDKLFDIDDPFSILQGANAANPCPYNGSVWMLRAGFRPDVWSDFSLEAASKMPFFEFPDDQAWFAHKMPGAKSWRVAESGVYGFQKPGWPKGGDALPANASIVAFFGKRDPAKALHLDWVKEHWR